MQTKRTIALTSFINEAYAAFGKVYRHEVKDVQIIEEYKQIFTNATFEEFYAEFEAELEMNIVEYANIDIINDYVRLYLKKFYDWQPFYEDDNQRIMEKGNEVGFLIKLKTNIEDSVNLLAEFFDSNNAGEPSFILIDIYNEKVNKNKDDSGVQINAKIEPDIRFDFQQIKLECEGLDTIIKKIKHINERMFDFKQWQLQYDEIDDDFIYGKSYIYTTLYYPKFIALCKIELERLDKLQYIEKEEKIHKAIENSPVIIQQNEPSPYTWNANDTDLLELVAALHASESIKRNDGNALTRKELIEYFQRIFDINIKQPEVKLTKAGDRNNNTAFLDKLAQDFRNFVAFKDKKLAKRK